MPLGNSVFGRSLFGLLLGCVFAYFLSTLGSEIDPEASQIEPQGPQVAACDPPGRPLGTLGPVGALVGQAQRGLQRPTKICTAGRDAEEGVPPVE